MALVVGTNSDGCTGLGDIPCFRQSLMYAVGMFKMYGWGGLGTFVLLALIKCILKFSVVGLGDIPCYSQAEQLRESIAYQRPRFSWPSTMGLLSAGMCYCSKVVVTNRTADGVLFLYGMRFVRLTTCSKYFSFVLRCMHCECGCTNLL